MIPKSRLLAVVVIIISGAVIVGFAVLYSNSPGCSSRTSTSIVHFTVIESSLGYNDSKDHYPTAWPVMTVHLGQMVCLHIMNIDPSEAHGFSMDNYVVSPIDLRPGASIDISFKASLTGTFIIRCTIPCAVHLYMLNGQLVVTS